MTQATSRAENTEPARTRGSKRPPHPNSLANLEANKWKPGQSGNPGGRPKDAARRARELADDDPATFLRVLAEIAVDASESGNVRVSAANAYLDRGWGRTPAYEPIAADDPLGFAGIDQRIIEVADELAGRRENAA